MDFRGWVIGGLLLGMTIACGERSLDFQLSESIAPPVPPDSNSDLVELGSKLFFETRLSESSNLSCASCHNPKFGFSNGVKYSVGGNGKILTRNVPSVVHSSLYSSHYWDGRAQRLEEQAWIPIFSKEKLGGDRDVILKRLSSDPQYPELFLKSFGSKEISISRIAKAIVAYEKSLHSKNSAYDRYVLEKDESALTPLQKKGLELFRGKANCASCHLGDAFTDSEFYNTGISQASRSDDKGRYTVTGDRKDLYAFRTPSLRSVNRTAPYMHDGSIETLEEVLHYYNRGGYPAHGNVLKPLGLTPEEKKAIVEFLKALDSEPVLSLGQGKKRL